MDPNWLKQMVDLALDFVVENELPSTPCENPKCRNSSKPDNTKAYERDMQKYIRDKMRHTSQGQSQSQGGTSTKKSTTSKPFGLQQNQGGEADGLSLADKQLIESMVEDLMIKRNIDEKLKEKQKQ